MSMIIPENPDIDLVIDLAWADEVSFDEIHQRTGLVEKEVIFNYAAPFEAIKFSDVAQTC